MSGVNFNDTTLKAPSGPSSSTDESLARFDGTTGAKIQGSGASTLTDGGILSIANSINTQSGGITSNSNLFAGSYVQATTYLQSGASSYHTWGGTSRIYAPSDGIIRLSNAANNDFTRLQFGGTTSSFPAIKRTTTALNFRLADDSADCPISAAAGTFSGNVEPATDDTYYIGKNDDDTPKAWKGVILKDQTTGTYYRLQIDSGAVVLVDLTD